jgi:hypothetical protein
MNEFIQKLDYHVDIQRVRDDLDYILNNHCTWEPDRQIGLRHRDLCENPWKDSVGGLPNKQEELLFSQWNADCPEYTKEILLNLAKQENISWGRIRFMLAGPKQGLSMHYDHQPRYHLVLQTNISAIFGECFNHSPVRAMCYHIPANGYWYKVDTTREHFVFNGGWEPRIHLVCCPA